MKDKPVITIVLPHDLDRLKALPAGQRILLSGTVYTLRDAGHKRLIESYQNGAPDIDVTGMTIYYCGPTPAEEHAVIGSCGPTTSARMDDYTPYLLERGLAVMIGKGERSAAVKNAMRQTGAVYLIAVGGAAAVYQSLVTENIPALYDDLGCEAMRKLTVRDMPLLIGIDATGAGIL